MPLDGNDSKATWQNPSVSRTTSEETKINTPPPFVPQRGYQARQEHVPVVPARSMNSSNDWKPTLDEDFPPEPEEDFSTPSLTKTQITPSSYTNTVVPTASNTANTVPPSNQGIATTNSPLHLSTQKVNNVQAAPARQTTLNEQVSYYSMLILVPFLFTVLTGLIILPQVASNRAYLPSQALIPLIVILLIIAVAQSFSILYAGTNNGLWAVCTLTAFFAFVLLGCFTLFGALTSFLIFIIIFVLYILLFRFYVHPVPSGYIELVQSFGQYRRTLYEGFNVLLPWEKVTPTLSIKETPWQTPVQRVQVSQTEVIVLRGQIIYQLEPQQAQDAILAVNNWEESLQAIFVVKLHEIATSFSPNFIAMLRKERAFTPHHDESIPFIKRDSRWQQVNKELLEQMQSRVRHWGVQVIDAQVFDVTIDAYNQYKHALGDEDTTSPASYAHQETAHSVTTMATMAAIPEQPKQAPSQLAASTPQSPLPSQPAQPPSVNIFKEEALISAYNQVQSGAVNDPETIRGIAKRFETVANSPNLYQNVSFDAMRAALSLYNEADRCEREISARAGTLFNDETRTDLHRPEDESTFLGA